MTIEKGPPPPPIPLPQGHKFGTSFLKKDIESIHTVNPLFSAKQAIDYTNTGVELVGDSNSIRRRGAKSRPLPKHPSKRHLGGGTKSFLQPSQTRQTPFPTGCEHTDDPVCPNNEVTQEQHQKDHMGRSFITIPDRHGRLKHISIGAPSRRRRILPPPISKKCF